MVLSMSLMYMSVRCTEPHYIACGEDALYCIRKRTIYGVLEERVAAAY
jgi:hypothetical protein